MRSLRLAAVPAVLLAAAACTNSTDTERAVGGAVIGASAAAILDENIVAGAGIGATAGVLADDVGVVNRR